MFTFHWSELIVIVIGGLVLILGLAFLMLRRRNDLLGEFLTPEEPDIEEEFFRVRKPKNAENVSPDELPDDENPSAGENGGSGTKNQNGTNNEPDTPPEQPTAN